jgi:hypothetical protein
MKSMIRLIAIAVLAAGCELDVDPAGATFTEEQKDRLVALSPTKLQASVNGLSSDLIQSFAIAGWGGSLHYDFGYPAACMIFDASGMDSPSENSGFNWFNQQLLFTDRTATGKNTYFLWELFYSHVKTANDIIASVDSATTDKNLKVYLGQALASRAFDYLHLVQIYQFTYKGHEQDLAVPIVTEKTPVEAIGNNPRATVEQVYRLILADLTRAIDLLAGYDRLGHKEWIDQQVAYGLRARANLLVEDWPAAAADAYKALENYIPYSKADVSLPSFNDITATSWIWGCAISENNDVVRTGIVNFPAHMCSLTGNGYSPGYAGRYINSKLWLDIPDDDVRKGWWIDSTMNSPLLDLTWRHTYNGREYDARAWFRFQAPYLNLKFGPYRGIYNNSINACDFPLMRVEEMILIRAEALAMGGSLSGGKQVLEEFVRSYRQPSFASTATTTEAFRDEIWFQRRVELWGEGFSFFDLKRLKKPLSRGGANYPSVSAFDLPAEHPILLWLIPETEMNTNKGIQANNPVIAVPTP